MDRDTYSNVGRRPQLDDVTNRGKVVSIDRTFVDALIVTVEDLSCYRPSQLRLIGFDDEDFDANET